MGQTAVVRPLIVGQRTVSYLIGQRQEAPDVDYARQVELRDKLQEYFNDADLRTLCFELNIPYEDLAGDATQEKVLALVDYARRTVRLHELVVACRATRHQGDEGETTMQQITIHFQPDEGTIDGRHVTTRGLHGQLFSVLRQADPTGATWLHRHPTPKPFSLVPLYTEAGQLAGLRLAAVTERAASLLRRAWERVWQQQRPLRLGWQEFRTVNVAPSPGPGWATLATRPPVREMVLHFLSPTSFKQGTGSLPLPLPANVFSGPARVWDAFAGQSLPPDWLAWCEQEVFVVGHRIETVAVKMSKREQFTGFVGDVKFVANEGTKTALCVWQALGELAAFCGVGHKTTMGMGAVARDGR